MALYVPADIKQLGDYNSITLCGLSCRTASSEDCSFVATVSDVTQRVYRGSCTCRPFTNPCKACQLVQSLACCFAAP